MGRGILRAGGGPYIYPEMARRKRKPSPKCIQPGRAVVVRPPRSKVMKISARNQIKGKILDVKKGATTAHIRLEIGPGQIITSSITNEAVDELGLKAGITAFAVIKASEVMIAVE